jgi:hypothetical protein
MDKFKLLSYIKCSFNTNNVLKSIEKFPQFKSWNVVKHEMISDRGLLLYVKNSGFNGCLFIVFDGNDFIIRKINKCGFVLLTNKTKYVSIFGNIFDLYLAH